MSLLHDYFNTRNLQAFQRLLDGSTERGQSTSGPSSTAPAGSSYTAGAGKSWSRGGGITGHSACDVNARDWFGRTPLHLACTAVESIEYVRALLKHPQIDVNLPDAESLWTPLHRALYSANFPAALLLLQRSDIDSSLKDLEGYTSFDVYNSTLDGTKPDSGELNAELFTWGANRNAALGVGDADDRTYPEHINIKSKEGAAALVKTNISARFSPIAVRQVQMSKLHTAVVTGENLGNLRLCGFGSGGRLGSGQHTQYDLKPLPSFASPVARVALGQDHTLILTLSGEVYSWGLSRFSQLGYVVEMTSTNMSRHEEPIQCTPKRIFGLLRKEVLVGVAASKNASACWNRDTVFTWGTNTGQLGYDKASQPVQILPRPVTKFTNAVIDIVMSDTVMAALLVTRQVECITNDRHFRINFPMQSFPTSIQPYRPPQSVKDAHIVKITCCDETFAALSSNGEAFTFSAGPTSNANESSSFDGRTTGPVFKPQKIWALRKKFSAVKDVALGSDGSIIICTEAGHVFVRTRSAKSSSSKAFKFERIPFLQRVTQVCANSTGAYGALRVDHRPKPIEVKGNTIDHDLKTVQPYMRFYRDQQQNGNEKSGGTRRRRQESGGDPSPVMFDEDPEDEDIEQDIETMLDLFEVLAGEQRMRKAGGGSINFDGARLSHDADTIVHLQTGETFPVHRVVLAARSSVLEGLISSANPLISDPRSKLSIKLLPAKPGPGLGVTKLTRLMISGCHPLSVLILLRYLYSDEVVAVWDRRVGTAVEEQLAGVDAHPANIKAELQNLARLLNVPALLEALEPPVKRDSAPTMARDMQRLFDTVQSSLPPTSPLLPDVILRLADRDVSTHSVILRARTPLFASFFDQADWTVKRWEANGTIRVNMTHLRWHVMRFVFGFMCSGSDKEMFHVLEFIDNVEDLLQFVFEVASYANELLLDRLVLICASVILNHCNLQNACYILADATYYHILPLIEQLQEYVSINMESFLQGHMLDEVPYALVKQLAKFVQVRQLEKSPFSRSDVFVSEMLNRHAKWLSEQDLPEPFIRTIARVPFKSGPKSSPQLSPRKVTHKTSFTTPAKARLVSQGTGGMLRRLPSGDDIFSMDEPDPTTRPSSFQEPSPLTSPPIWKAASVPRVDMKAIMAEAHAASQGQPGSFQNLSQSPRTSSNLLVRAPHPADEISGKSIPKPGSATAWKINVDQAGLRGPTLGTPPAASFGPPPSGSRPPPSSSPNSTRSPQQPSTPSKAHSSGLGPVISPTRQTQAKPSSVRNSSGSGKAWTQPPVQPASKAPPATGMSFAAIQDSQKQVKPVKDKRSLREIQEEEQSLQAEAEFLVWWTAEEERVKQEELAFAQLQESLNSSPKQKKPKARPKGKGKLAQGEGVGSVGTSNLSKEMQKSGKRSDSAQQAKRKPQKPSQN